MADELKEFSNLTGKTYTDFKTGVTIASTTATQTAVVKNVSVTRSATSGSFKLTVDSITGHQVANIDKTSSLSGNELLGNSQSLIVSNGDVPRFNRLDKMGCMGVDGSTGVGGSHPTGGSSSSYYAYPRECFASSKNRSIAFTSTHYGNASDWDPAEVLRPTQTPLSSFTGNERETGGNITNMTDVACTERYKGADGSWYFYIQLGLDASTRLTNSASEVIDKGKLYKIDSTATDGRTIVVGSAFGDTSDRYDGICWDRVRYWWLFKRNTTIVKRYDTQTGTTTNINMKRRYLGTNEYSGSARTDMTFRLGGQTGAPGSFSYQPVTINGVTYICYRNGQDYYESGQADEHGFALMDTTIRTIESVSNCVTIEGWITSNSYSQSYSYQSKGYVNFAKSTNGNYWLCFHNCYGAQHTTGDDSSSYEAGWNFYNLGKAAELEEWFDGTHSTDANPRTKCFVPDYKLTICNPATHNETEFRKQINAIGCANLYKHSDQHIIDMPIGRYMYGVTVWKSNGSSIFDWSYWGGGQSFKGAGMKIDIDAIEAYAPSDNRNAKTWYQNSHQGMFTWITEDVSSFVSSSGANAQNSNLFKAMSGRWFPTFNETEFSNEMGTVDIRTTGVLSS